MSDWKLGPHVGGLVRRGRKICLSLAVLVAAASLAAAVVPGSARAQGIYVGGSGFGFSFGTRGYRGHRGSFFYGAPGFAGPPYRPYGAPYHYHPYDMRAYPYRSRVYVNPPRGHRYRGQPQRVPYTKTGLAPFTPRWYAYCSRKFKSFNPDTGTYLAYSGKFRFCR
ncbi:BA14K family protein [Roseibium sp.]|uniref:BA14K family protein n=1 Tax=Roseibium sp. TaxID=1936156 RepID=UPI003264B787